MNVHTHAIYEHGILKLADPLDIPDKTPVEVTVTLPEEAKEFHGEAMLELADIAGKCDLPEDMSERHDHHRFNRGD
jgi:predicted DNA-binding antitoxin AbrB/MazE fold protein